ncbi:MAG: sulfurtransferase [Pontibacterium sp.]
MTLPLVVSAKALAAVIDRPDVCVVDLSSKENYLAGHLPGALHLEPSKLQLGSGPVPNKLPSLEQLNALVMSLNLSKDTHVVAYDDQKGPLAGRFIWTLHLLGFTQCSFLNGHKATWQAEGYSLEQVENLPASSENNPNVAIQNPELRITKEALLGDQHPGLIWDARSPAEYRGEKIVNAQKGGHIPSAINFEWTQCFANDTGELKAPEQLAKELADVGITGDSWVSTHCQTHRRSGLTYIAGKHAGLKMRCYDGSWFEWGNNSDTPVEQ